MRLAAAALLAQLSEAFLCRRLEEDAIGWMPRGWKRGARKLSEVMGCVEAAERPVLLKSTTEDYMQDLEFPGVLFKADLERNEGGKIGAGIKRRSDYIELEDIHEEGAVPKWNTEHPARSLRSRDRIICVNGKEGNATQMAEELKTSPKASLRVFRVSPDDHKAIDRRKREKDAKKVAKEAGPRGLGQGIPEPFHSHVVTLHANNIERYVQLQPLVLVMFYANWCGHCQQIAADYTQAALILANRKDLPRAPKLAKYDDGDEANRFFHAGAPDKYNFSSYPSLKLFHNGIHEGFYGEHSADELAAHVAAVAKGQDIEEEVKKSLLRTRPMMYRPDIDPEDVLDLEPETFDDTVLKEYDGNNRVWIIEYYSDKCPFCKSLKPEIVKASQELQSKFKGKVKLAAVNSRAFNDLAQRFGVTSYPWIISIYAGRKLEDMAGLGGADSVVKWATGMKKDHWKKEPVFSTEPILITPKTDESNLAPQPAFNNTGTWRELLGRRTWFFLHSLAAKYPDEPTAADEAAMRNLVASLGQLYACPICRSHLQVKLQSSEMGPVATESRTAVSLWFCKLHNVVNRDLGHELVPCNAFGLDLMYLKSCGECSANTTGQAEEEKEEVEWDYFRFAGGQSSLPRTREEL